MKDFYEILREKEMDYARLRKEVEALRQFLQKHPHVATVTEPPQNEGGGGATVVELKV